MNASAPASGSLVRHSAVYFVGSLLSVLGGILMLPVYTHALTPADYGLLETALRFVSVCMAVGFVGIRQCYARFYFEHDTEQWHKLLTSTVLIANLAVAVFVMLPVLVLVALIGKHIGGTNLSVGMAAVLAAWLAAEATFMLGLTHLQVRVHSTRYVIAQALRLTLLLGGNFLLLNTFKLKFEGAMLGNLLTALVTGGVAAALMFRSSGFHWSMDLIKKMVRFSLPYVPTLFFAYIISNADRFAVLYFGALASLGILSLASKIGEMALMIFVAPVESVWSPFAFRVHAEAEGPSKIGALYTRYTALCVLLALGVSLAAPLAVRILAEQSYQSAADLVPIVAIGWVFTVLAALSDIGILIAKKTYLKPRVSGAAAALAVIFQLLLTPRYGIYGAAVATALTQMATFTINRAVSGRLYKMITRRRDFLIIAVTAGAGYFVGRSLIEMHPTVIGTLIGTALGSGIYLIALLAGHIVTVSELRGIAGKLGARRLAFWR
jgi:O-antigen/teichoic acid export membrane protein